MAPQKKKLPPLEQRSSCGAEEGNTFTKAIEQTSKFTQDITKSRQKKTYQLHA